MTNCLNANEALAILQEWENNGGQRVKEMLPLFMSEIDKIIRMRASYGYGNAILPCNLLVPSVSRFEHFRALADAIADELLNLGYRVVHEKGSLEIEVVWCSIVDQLKERK